MDALSALANFFKIAKELSDRDEKSKKEVKRLERKMNAFERIGDVLSAIGEAARVVPHGVQNKNRWAERLREFAESEKEWLAELRTCCDLIAFKLEDHSFDHDRPDARSYCCDELILDMNLFVLASFDLLSIEKMRPSLREQLERLERAAFATLWAERPGVGSFRREGEPHTQSEIALEDVAFQSWKTGNFCIGDHQAMDRYCQRRLFSNLTL